MVDKKDIQDESFEVLEEESLSKHEEIELETEDELMGDKLKILRQKLKGCEDEKMKALEDLHRTRADFLNSKRRLEEQFLRDKERASDKIIMELLPLVDSFDTAMADTELWKTIDERWRVGIEAIHIKLLGTLKSNHVVPLDPIGQAFNPEEHEAVGEQVVSDASKAHTIITVLQKGFKRNDTVIRPARVIVGTT